MNNLTAIAIMAGSWFLRGSQLVKQAGWVWLKNLYNSIILAHFTDPFEVKNSNNYERMDQHYRVVYMRTLSQMCVAKET